MATIKDVALLAGVGVGTASSAVSGKGAVSPVTLARVQDAVRALEFRPSRVARALSSRSLGMVGVYVPTFEGTFFAPILQAIDGELRACGYHMVAASNFGQGSRRDKALNGISFLVDRECDGLLVIDGYMRDEDLFDLRERMRHVVVINRSVSKLEEACFSVDHVAAGRLAAQALLARGHRHIAAMHSLRHGQDVVDRMSGFREELALHGLALAEEFVIDGLLTYANGWNQAGVIARQPRRSFSALFCVADVLAMAAMARLQEAGIQVPRDLSIMGYDDAEFAAYTSPPLTTVRNSTTQVAANACRHLINLCYGTQLEVQRHFDSQVIWRKSVVPGPHPAVVQEPEQQLALT